MASEFDALTVFIADEKTQEEVGEMREVSKVGEMRQQEVSIVNVDILSRLVAVHESMKSNVAQRHASHVRTMAMFDALKTDMNALRVETVAYFDVTTARLDRVVARLKGLTRKLDAVEAKRGVDNAREFNYSVAAGSTTMQFRSIVKYVCGHPSEAGLPNAVDKVVFQENYDIGDQPPYHLMPLNNGEINKWSKMMKLPELRRRLRSIYWFYNDERLILAFNANRAACMKAILNVKAYLLNP
ncbi:hypothetical protein CASFOL_034962 [Castilleja foliolosa]|uniref:Uncharacterized protein n=1 Tax=Castilleja foliolosa TaxID=1961234 RepID=A0ABD3BTP3_9LAMI